MQKNTVQSYELTFILDEKAGQEDGVKKVAELKGVIEKLGGSFTKEEMWGRRELAYPIKRNRSGFYVTIWMDLPTQSLKPLDAQLRFDESVIRSLVTKAYTTAQPGTLYPVIEEKVEREPRAAAATQEEKSSAEEMLRRSSTSASSKKAATDEAAVEEIPEEERLKKLDETLNELLKDDEV